MLFDDRFDDRLERRVDRGLEHASATTALERHPAHVPAVSTGIPAMDQQFLCTCDLVLCAGDDA